MNINTINAYIYIHLCTHIFVSDIVTTALYQNISETHLAVAQDTKVQHLEFEDHGPLGWRLPESFAHNRTYEYLNIYGVRKYAWNCMFMYTSII